MKWEKVLILTALTVSLVLTGNCMAQKVGIGVKTGVYSLDNAFQEAFQAFELFSSFKFMRPVKKIGPEGEEQTVYKDFMALEAGLWIPQLDTLKLENIEASLKIYLFSCPVCPCVLYTGAAAYMKLEQAQETLGFAGLIGSEIKIIPNLALLSEFRFNTKSLEDIMPEGPLVTVGAKLEL